jgi:diguanylate cyclase (GGDEF)-like protein
MILAEVTMSFSATVLLAAMATLGYVLGRRRTEPQSQNRNNSRHEIQRAMSVAKELEAIAYRLRKSMAFHVPSIVKFNTQLKHWEKGPDVSWHELCDRADDLLKPALRLSTEISNAYADLLQQMTHLSTFAELRSDPLTGVSNRRAFDESLEELLASHHADNEAPLSLAMLDLDHFKRINDAQGHLAGDRVLQDMAQLLKAGIREGDILARFGGEEFVVLMPRTQLRSAANLAERLRQQIEEKLATTVSIGVASSLAEESSTSLIARADAALYTAKKEGRNCVALHEGEMGNIATIRTAPLRAPEQPLPVLSTSVRDNPLLDPPATIPFYQNEAC